MASLDIVKSGICSPDEVEEVVAEFKRKADENASAKGNLLRDHSIPRVSWYGGPSDNPMSHWQLLKDYLRNSRGISDFDLDNIDTASTNVVANLSRPHGDESESVKGMVVGYVQSGKTTNYSAVIAKAIDSGYRLIVVLAGIHNNLRLQTEKRLTKEISDQRPEAATNLTKVDEKGDFSRKLSVRAERALGRQDGFAIAVLKKNASVLRSFDFWLSEAREETLHSCPILLIDDESDFASVNTADIDAEPTTINRLIRTIFSKFKTSTYVGYTATPFANIFIDANVEDDLYPRDFLLTLDKPMHYFGSEELFGSESLSGNGDKQALPVVRIIPDDEANNYAVNRKKTYKSEYFSEIGDSLRTAILSFFISGSIRLARGQCSQHITMLIHTSNLTEVHNKIHELVSDFVNEFKVASGKNLGNIKDELQDLYANDFLPLCKSLNVSELLIFDDVWNSLFEFIKDLKIIVDNSKSEERLSFEGEHALWGIVIGGNTLSRGLTIEGLTVSYYVRNARGYDTLLQMGRWFGYRPRYVDLTRVFVTEDLFSKFFHLATVENEIREEIRALAENDERPIDVAIRIRRHPDMMITSNLKMRSASDASLTYSGTKIQERYVLPECSQAQTRNLTAVYNLVKSINRLKIPRWKSSFKYFEAYHIYKNVQSELILQFLDEYQFSDANVKFDKRLLKSYIFDLNQVSELQQWSVAFVSSRTGIPLELGLESPVYKVQRSVVESTISERDRNAKYLTALSPPQDEIVDIEPSEFKVLQAASPDDFVKELGKTWSSIRMQLRSKDRGLLLIYPLESTGEMNKVIESSNGRLSPLKSECDLFGLTIVFPKAKNVDNTYEYAVNGSV